MVGDIPNLYSFRNTNSLENVNNENLYLHICLSRHENGILLHF